MQCCTWQCLINDVLSTGQGHHTGKLKKTNLSLNNPSNLLSIDKYNYIAIEGNIGSGKTSLSKQISADFNTKLMLERFIDNPFLPKFYENPRDFAFKLEYPSSTFLSNDND